MSPSKNSWGAWPPVYWKYCPRWIVTFPCWVCIISTVSYKYNLHFDTNREAPCSSLTGHTCRARLVIALGLEHTVIMSTEEPVQPSYSLICHIMDLLVELNDVNLSVIYRYFKWNPLQINDCHLQLYNLSHPTALHTYEACGKVTQ